MANYNGNVSGLTEKIQSPVSPLMVVESQNFSWPASRERNVELDVLNMVTFCGSRQKGAIEFCPFKVKAMMYM